MTEPSCGRSWSATFSPGSRPASTGTGCPAASEVAPSGNYKFRLSPISGGEGEDGDGATNFEFYGFKFPISRGKHTYGDGVGADRGDHTHAGQDVLADCGLPLVAVRAGTIQAQGYNGGAGNYLVIDGKNDDHDYVYMHLLQPAWFAKATVSRPVSASAPSAAPAPRPPVTSTSRCGRRPAGTRAESRCSR